MKFVLNKCHGRFALSQFAKETLHLDTYYTEIDRKAPDLVALVEKYGTKKCSDFLSAIEVVEIPDEVTDYRITEYDGFENIIYVLNGKIKDAE